LDLRPGDIYWCTADPGWVTGTSYGIVAPLCVGATVIVDEREFDVGRWYATLAAHRVNVWYTAPTAIRMLMRAGAARAREHDLSALRLVASVGEPLHPEGVTWGEEAFGHRIHDTWWQTETGAIMIANVPGMDIRPGSMGKPVPGIEVAILALGEGGRAAVRHGAVTEIVEPDAVGELALRPGWPSMFRGYLHAEERYEACFAGGWYSPATLPAATLTAICGSADVRTTSSRAPATSSGLSRWRPHCWSTRPSPRQACSESPTPSPASSCRRG
jgi:acetyl-CoA synthetase